MNPSDSSDYSITRRDFMKKTALTVGAITLLAQGTGLAVGTGSGSGSWGMICANPTYETSDVDYLTGAIVVAQTVLIPAEETFRIRVTIDSNKIIDPPNTDAYDECLIQYTAKVSVVLPEGEPFVDHFIDKLVIADKDGGNEDWQTTYDSWDGDSKTIDASVGDHPAAHVKITIRANNGLSYGLFISSEWTNLDSNPHVGYQLPATPFEEFHVPYPHVFVPKLKK